MLIPGSLSEETILSCPAGWEMLHGAPTLSYIQLYICECWAGSYMNAGTESKTRFTEMLWIAKLTEAWTELFTIAKSGKEKNPRGFEAMGA